MASSAASITVTRVRITTEWMSVQAGSYKQKCQAATAPREGRAGECLSTSWISGLNSGWLGTHRAGGSGSGEFCQERIAYGRLLLRRELRSGCAQVKNVNRHLAFSVNQRDLDVALMLCQHRTDAVEKTWPVLRNHLHQG